MLKLKENKGEFQQIVEDWRKKKTELLLSWSKSHFTLTQQQTTRSSWSPTNYLTEWNQTISKSYTQVYTLCLLKSKVFSSPSSSRRPLSSKFWSPARSWAQWKCYYNNLTWLAIRLVVVVVEWSQLVIPLALYSTAGSVMLCYLRTISSGWRWRPSARDDLFNWVLFCIWQH